HRRLQHAVRGRLRPRRADADRPVSPSGPGNAQRRRGHQPQRFLSVSAMAGRNLRLAATPLLLLAACSAEKKPVYQDPDGLRITPPPGWLERARGNAMTGAMAHKQNAPLPPLGGTGKSAQERLLVRYDLVTSGHL